MPDILQRLIDDHVNVARLLNLLERELETIQAGRSADFELMHDIMVYMTMYPDQTHHPLEDLVFQRMLEHDHSLSDTLATVTKEHEGLAQKGSRFKDALEHVVDGVLVSREELEAQGRDYVEFLRYHMAKEERHLFPTAQQLLNAEDWTWVSEAMEAREDPVFGATVEQQFRSLYNHIRQQA